MSEGINVKQQVTIDKSPEELYRFWRNFENLPRFMRHLEAVQTQSNTRSHWVAKAPLGTSVEWDAEIVDERPNEMIVWRSLPDADVVNAGAVTFQRGPTGRGTEVRVLIEYAPPAGVVGATIAKLFGEEPNQQVKEDLWRFKQLMEAGEIATNEGQPSGTRSVIGKVLSRNS
ncbi:MAG TPA: SRPBCC family protein [Herpetosiphonaceae bacterium]